MERIINKLKAKSTDIYKHANVTFAFLGDSVTQGCFELIVTDGGFDTVFEPHNSYSNKLKEIFARYYPKVALNIINAGLSGGTASNGLERLERDVIRYCPDLTVVCFGLNDSSGAEAGLKNYTDALHNIFEQLKKVGSEVIFMTPNMMCTRISRNITDPKILNTATCICDIQTAGTLDLYINSAIAVANACGVKVCDCYAKWKTLERAGVDITGLLSNDINHPTREMHNMFAKSLAEIILGLN